MFAVLSVLGFYACNDAEPLKENVNAATEGSILATQLYYTRADLQDKSPEEIRAIFNTLTPQNRYDLFVDKFNHCLTLNPTINQTYVIKKLLNSMSVDAYVWGSKEHLDFTNFYLPSILSNLKQEFTNQEGLNIFYNLYDLDNLNDIVVVGSEGESDCGCNKGSTFGGCQFGGDNCLKSNCAGATHGCGFGWFFKCDGLCDDIPSPDGDKILYH